MLTRRRLLATFGLTAAAAATACGLPPATAAAGHLVQLQLVERATGEVLREHRHRGVAHVAGQPGARYAVRLSNRTAARVLVVLSVDGVNAISGQTAAAGQTGYVLAPWQTADITGWRKSDAEAAAFYFTALPDSYAARTDRPHNVGVIGVAVFRERVPTPPPVPFEQSAPAAGADRRPAQSAPDAARRAEGATASAGATPAPGAPAAGAREIQRLRDAERLGTGHGEREYAPINRTAFERASTQPAEIVQIRYDSHANLVAAGVIDPPRRWGAPEPFPGYVPDPR
ncbi:MAG: hypothetical protein JNJ89_13750 [Rubrivivax sp.]|nr:hypothetical protein [Rubrivivax sp.]